MPRTIFDISNFVQYLIRKERGVFQTYNQICANLHAGQMDYFQECFEPYGVTNKLHDALRPFRVYYQFASNSAGMVVFPSDYQHLLGSPFTIAGSTVNEVVFVQESELPFALKSQLRPVSNAYPIAVDTTTGFSIYPQQAQAGFFTYLKTPNIPVVGVTQSGRAITYDAATSTQLEWTESYINAVIARSLKFVGINMDEQTISQFAETYSSQEKP